MSMGPGTNTKCVLWAISGYSAIMSANESKLSVSLISDGEDDEPFESLTLIALDISCVTMRNGLAGKVSAEYDDLRDEVVLYAMIEQLGETRQRLRVI